MGFDALMRGIRILAAIVGLLAGSLAGAAAITNRMSLTEAIEAVRDQGFEIVYSSQLVGPWMRVRETPVDPDPLKALDEALAHYQLDLVEGPDGRWLIVASAPEERPTPYAVRGRVLAADTGEPLGDARIRAKKRTAMTNKDGQFELPGLTAREVDLLILADGYVGVRKKINQSARYEPLQVSLQPVVLPQLEEVLIVASRHAMFDRRGLADQFLTAEEIRLMPHFANDAFRAFHRLPGAAANDFQAPFHLRGGAIDEVKVQLDGLELFEPFHMRSLFSPLSIIDPGIIQEAQVLSGGFTVTHGNHMSGVIDIASERPDSDPVHQLGVSFVNSFARSTGAFESGRGGYQVSARRGYLDLLTEQVVEEGEELTPRYSDIFAKVTYMLSDTLDITGHLLLAQDDVRFIDPGDGEDFRNDGAVGYGWLTLDWEPRDGVQWTNSIFTGRTDSTEDGQQISPPFLNIDRFYSRDFDVSGLQSDLIYRFNDTGMWRFGFRYRQLEGHFDYHIDSVRQSDFANSGAPFTLNRHITTTRDGDEIGVYATYRFQPMDSLILEAGLRWDKQTYTDTSGETQTSPRLNGLLRLGERTDLRLAWGRFHQAQSIDDLQVPDGFTGYFPPEQAEHRVLGLRHRFLSGIELQADLYDKHYSDLRPRFENVLDQYEYARESNFDRTRIQPESARAYGMELTVRRRRPEKLDWWLSYTWSKVEDTINGIDVPRTWDQRNALTANLTWRGERWTISAIGRYHSGWPRTPLLVLPVLDTAGNVIGIDSDLSQRNDLRYDDYSRLDIRLSRTIDLERGSFEYYLEVFNVFNSDNECCISSHDLTVGPTLSATPTIDSFMPLFPSFGFVWTFGPGAY